MTFMDWFVIAFWGSALVAAWINTVFMARLHRRVCLLEQQVSRIEQDLRLTKSAVDGLWRRPHLPVIPPALWPEMVPHHQEGVKP